MGRKIKHFKDFSPIKLPNTEETPPEKPEKTWQELRDESVQKRILEFRPLNSKQSKLINSILTSVITIATGCAGTGRTYVSCAIAAKLLLEDKVDKIILTRPLVECGEKMGFLPGDSDEKIRPYLYPLTDALEELLGDNLFNKLEKEGKIQFRAVGHMRGSSFKNSIILVDEAQNLTYTQLKMILTRVGQNCRLVVNGDSSQSDLVQNIGDFERVIDKLQVLRSDISFIYFDIEDVVRSGIVQKIVQIL